MGWYSEMPGQQYVYAIHALDTTLTLYDAA